ncbi:MAG: patatin family protein [Lachnospiraceae bacterium]|nr:patatin family protein [Lachnospiraceae bacterium]
MKKGLILEGGAMRGLFTAGVIDVMMENGITYDGAIGVSAGAIFGCNYKSGQIGRVVRYNKLFCRDKRFCSIRSLLQTGNIYNTDFCYGEVPLKLDVFDFEAYESNPMDFYAVCTDIETGKAVYHKYLGKEDNGFDWLRASASMPLVSQIVEISGQKMLDGGISDSIPVKYFESIGFDRNVVVLTRPYGYRKEKNRMLPLIRRKYDAYPKLIEDMTNRHLMYNNELDYIEKQEAAGNLFVIRPASPLPVKRVERDPDKLQSAYDIGRKTAEGLMDKLRLFLEEK